MSSSTWIASEFGADNLPNYAILHRWRMTPEEARDRLLVASAAALRFFEAGDLALPAALNISWEVELDAPEAGELREAKIGDVIVACPRPDRDPNWRAGVALYRVLPARVIHLASNGKRFAITEAQLF